MSERIGIIGLGLVGSAIRDRLIGAGFGILGYDIDSTRGGAAASASEVARACRRLILSLPDSDAVGFVLAQIEPKAGGIIIDTTTGDPERVAGFCASLEQKGVSYLDATIGGSSQLVRSAGAVVICGGDESAFARCQDLFVTFANRTFHLGPAGSGSRMKLVLNLVLGLNRIALAEGLGFAMASGIDGRKALDVLKAGPAYSRAMDNKGEKMLERDFQPEARLTQQLKDVQLILAAGEANGANLPFTARHREVLEKLIAEGFGAEDNSAVMRAFLPR